MLFNSLTFILGFLPIVLIGFFACGKLGYKRIAIFILVFASLVFYSWWNPSYLSLILISIIFNYAVGDRLGNLDTNKAIRQKKFLLVIGIVSNLALLAYFKYANFFLDSLNTLFGSSWNAPQVILPLAISFFTFQQISYLIDAYNNQTKKYNFLYYCLFVTFFPQLIAGPIVHHKDIIPQFSQQNFQKDNREDLVVGITIFVIGLFKKVAIADSLAPLANGIFAIANRGGDLSFFDGWSAALFYTFQLYFDFSGYSEMAIGSARMFGIKLPVNFNSPYKAVSIADFWRRWHITLSNFLRDYLYIPLGGNRHGDTRKIINLVLTMSIGGLWHGAGWTFVLWGGIHGCYLSLNHLWRNFSSRCWGKNLDRQYPLIRILSRGITFISVVFAWVLFRAETFDSAVAIWRAAIGLNGIELSDFVQNSRSTLIIVLLCLWVWLLPNVQEWMFKYQPVLNLPKIELNSLWQKLHWRPNVNFGLIMGIIIFCIAKTSLNSPTSEFLYFNF